MAYSNVTPPPLPEYDSDTYGFYLLVFNYRKDAEDWYMVHLFYSAWRFQYEEGVGVTNTAVTFTRTYSDGSWTDEMQNPETLALNPGMNGVVYQRIYTNANIFNGNEIWLAENSVTPVETEKFPIKDFLNGLIMALCGRVVQYPKREPVAYLYNGVRLPKLPDWDKEAYPYAAIVTKANGEYRFYADAEAFTIGSGNYLTRLWPDVVYLLENETWVEETAGGFYFVPIWSNTDIYYDKNVEGLAGTLAFSASDPVPVYD